MRARRSVALIGGAFNPPHVGHWLAAAYVHATQGVSEVWLVPSFHHPFGKALEPFEHRIQMCERMAAEAAGWLKISAVEREVGGEGWTIDVLKHLKLKQPEVAFTWVIGSDIVKDLPLWKDVDGIRRLARLLVLRRSGHPAAEAVGPSLAEVSSTQVREALAHGELPRELVPARVLEYCVEHGLYGLPTGARSP